MTTLNDRLQHSQCFRCRNQLWRHCDFASTDHAM